MENFTIKLGYQSKMEAIHELQKMTKEGNRKLLALNTLVGEVESDGNCVLSSKQRGASLSEFVGCVVQRENAVYLEGIIQPRSSRMKLLYGLIIFNTLFGILLMFSGNPIFQVVSVLFITVPWLNVWVAKREITSKHL